MKIYNRDCMEAMKEMSDNQFDLAIVDPPYGIDMGNKINNIKGGVKHKSKDWDNKTPNKEYYNELFRVSKNQIIWGANYFVTEIQKNNAFLIVTGKHRL